MFDDKKKITLKSFFKIDGAVITLKNDIQM